MLIGYASVTVRETSPGYLVDALERAGCAGAIFLDTDTGGEDHSRRGLERAIEAGRPGDTLVVTRLDRLASTLEQLLKICSGIVEAGLHLRSLEDGLDTAIQTDFFDVLRTIAHLLPSPSLSCFSARAASAHIEVRPLGRASSITDAIWQDMKIKLSRGINISSVARYYNQRPQAIYYRLAREITESDYLEYKSALALGASHVEAVNKLRLFSPAIEYYSKIKRRKSATSRGHYQPRLAQIYCQSPS
jgi:hypothetical protein